MGTNQSFEAARLLITGVEGKRPSLWERILTWADSHQPRWPWRRPGDPYRILVGELLLDKTASPVNACQRFLHAFPSVSELLAADEDAVDDILDELRLERHRGAIMKFIRGLAVEGKGGLPCNSATLSRITGLDRHHIRAVLCFGYGLPIAVVNGDALRMLRRIFAGSLPPQPSAGLVEAVAESLVFYQDPQTYNGAVLELAELVCRREAPDCRACPVASVCDSALGAPPPEGPPLQPLNRSLVKTG
jgi:A/G-specific adenine glycosylase